MRCISKCILRRKQKMLRTPVYLYEAFCSCAVLNVEKFCSKFSTFSLSHKILYSTLFSKIFTFFTLIIFLSARPQSSSDNRLPGAVVNNRVVLLRHSVEHSHITEHVHHEVQEAASCGPLHYSTEQSKGMGGVEKSGACT